MGVSAIGQGMRLSAVRYAVATVLVFLALFYYLYGPPLTPGFDEAAHRRCNELTGSSYRGYVLEWRTTTYNSIDIPHWTCFDLTKPGHPGTSLGWWVDP